MKMPNTLESLMRRARTVLRATTIDLVRFHPRSHLLARRMRLLESHNINLIFDVGANRGQYASQMRTLGYRGRIVSFEPLSEAYAELRRRSSRDRAWQTVRCALGDAAGKATINVSGNSESSSLLPMLERHRRSAPQSDYIGTEAIEVDTLESAIATHVRSGEQLFVKLDAQGYERRIIDGARTALDRVRGLQVEMSLIPLYDGELLLCEMVQLLASRGFILMSLEPGHSDPSSGQLLQTDGIFYRE